MYKDKLQNCSCNQFHYISTYKQVETNSMTKNRGGNNGSENGAVYFGMCVMAFHKSLVPSASGYHGDGDISFFRNIDTYVSLYPTTRHTSRDMYLQDNAERTLYLISF